MSFEYGDFRLKFEIALRDGLKCYYCGHAFSKNIEGYYFMTIDHMTSQKEMNYELNAHDIRNLRLSCARCNSTKGKKSFNDSSPELKRFKDDMKQQDFIEEKWAENQLKFFQALHDKGIHQWPDIKSNLIEELKTKPDCKSVRIYKPDSEWIEILFQSNIWFFHCSFYLLQAYFLTSQGEQFEHLIQELLRDYKISGYHLWQRDICKYIEPSDEVAKVANDILTEMRKIADFIKIKGAYLKD